MVCSPLRIGLFIWHPDNDGIHSTAGYALADGAESDRFAVAGGNFVVENVLTG